MPESVDILDDLVEQRLQTFINAGCCRFIDVGAGTGKHCKMLRGLVPDPDFVRVEAVEVDSGYVTAYRLKDLYDEVYNMDVGKFIDYYVDYDWDVCIIADCLEHLRKSVGMDVLNFFVYRTKKIIVTYPVRLPQGSWDGHKQEAHISVWDEQDFSLFEHTHVAKSFMRLVVVEGYLK